MGEIEDMGKAQLMAKAEKRFRDLARDPSYGPPATPEEKRQLDEAAERKGEAAGEKYDEERRQKEVKGQSQVEKSEINLENKE